MNNYINKIIQGDALEKLKQFPDESVNMVMNSPPSWALRDYGVDGQIGLESDLHNFIDKQCAVFDEVKRVLRGDGICWVNLGDTYFTKTGASKPFNNRPNQKDKYTLGNKQFISNIPQKSLCMIPQRFAIEMINRGWILRNTIIWHKPKRNDVFKKSRAF